MTSTPITDATKKIIVEAFAAGDDIPKIARYLDDLGIPTSRGARLWSPAVVTRVISSIVYPESAHTGIVDTDTARRARVFLRWEDETQGWVKR